MDSTQATVNVIDPLKQPSGAGSLTHVNNDVLLLIADYLDFSGIWRLANTCKQLHAILLDRAIRNVYLMTPRQLLGFTIYVSADSTRASRVRSLTFASMDPDIPGSQHAPAALYMLLSRTKNLSCLVMKVHYEHYVTQSRLLWQAVNALPSLKRMELSFPGSTALDGLSHMCSRLQELTIDRALSYTSNPLPHSGALERLEKLTICCSGDDEFLSDGIWPSVGSLTLQDVDIPISMIVRAFPNICTFTFFTMGPNFEVTPQACFWPHLDQLTTFWVEATRLDVFCPVRQVELLHIPEDDECLVDDWDEYLRIMDQIRPIVLSFPIVAKSESRLPSFLSETAYKRLRCLTITLAEESKIEGIYDWIHSLHSSIGNQPLVSFCLRIRRPYDVPWEDVEENLDPSTPLHIPTVLSRALRRTQYIGIDIVNRRDFEPYWWCAVRKQAMPLELFRIPDAWGSLLTKAFASMDETPDAIARVERCLPHNLLTLLKLDDDQTNSPAGEAATTK